MAADPSAAPEATYRQELRRALGFRDLLIYGMVFMVPIAPMGIYGFVSSESFGMVPLVYLIGIIAMVFTALSYRQMSRRFPIAGSVYSYVQRGLNPYLGFVFGWMILIDYLLVPALLYRFSALWLHTLVPGVPLWGYVLAFVVFISVINALGITVAASANFLMLTIELLTLATFLAFVVLYVFIQGHGTGGFSSAGFYRPEHMNAGFFATATSLAVLSFLGFDAISTLAEETHHPRRTVGNATVTALVLLGLIFMVQTYAATLVHPTYQSLDANLGFFQIGRQAGGQVLYVLLLAVNVMAAGIANALAAQLAVSRILYSISRDKLLPFSNVIGRIHPRFRTPTNAIILVGLLSIAIALILSADKITLLVNFGALTSFMALHVAVFWHFVIREQRRSAGALFTFGVLPAVGLAIIAYVWSGFDSLTFEVGFGWLVLGLILLATRTAGFRRMPPILNIDEQDSEAEPGGRAADGSPV